MEEKANEIRMKPKERWFMDEDNFNPHRKRQREWLELSIA